MQTYNCCKNKDGITGHIYSGEELDIAGVAKDKDGNEIDLANVSLLQIIIRNMNGVVHIEYSTSPIDKQQEIETSGSKFTAKLLAEDSKNMVGLYVVETRLTIGDDTFISVSKPFEVINNFIKRTNK